MPAIVHLTRLFRVYRDGFELPTLLLETPDAGSAARSLKARGALKAPAVAGGGYYVEVPGIGTFYQGHPAFDRWVQENLHL